MNAFPKDDRFEVKSVEEAQTEACFSVISQLRPYLHDPAAWRDRATALRAGGYRIMAVWEDDTVVAMAGYRLGDNMIYGKFLYIDDLVTDARKRGLGLGALLLEKLQETGRREDCQYMVLDTAATNTQARRFYQREGLMDLAVGFIKPLNEASAENLRQYAQD